MKKLFVLVLLICLSLTITGCGKKEEEKKDTIVGTYAFNEIKDETGSFNSEQWKALTGIEMSLIIREDKTASRITKYKENGKVQTIENNFTYDDSYFYGTIEDNDKDNKYYSYEYKDGIIKLKDLSKELETIETYKK